MVNEKNAMILAALGSAIDFSVAHEVPLANVVPNPAQPRTEFNEDELHELAASMKNMGQKDAAFVLPRLDGTYFMISGERRWRALQRTHIPFIRAHFCRRELSARETYLLSCYGNAKQVEQSTYDNVVMVKNLLAEELSHEEIAVLLSRSLSWVNQHASIAFNLDVQVLEMMRASRDIADRILLDDALKIIAMTPSIQLTAAQCMLANKKKGGNKASQRAAFQVFVEQYGVRDRRGNAAKRTINGELTAIFSRFNRDIGSFAGVPEGMFVANLRQSGLDFLTDLLERIDLSRQKVQYIKRAFESLPLVELAKMVDGAEKGMEDLRVLVARAHDSLQSKQ